MISATAILPEALPSMEGRQRRRSGRRHRVIAAGWSHVAVEDRAGCHRRHPASEIHRPGGRLGALAVREMPAVPVKLKLAETGGGGGAARWHGRRLRWWHGYRGPEPKRSSPRPHWSRPRFRIWATSFRSCWRSRTRPNAPLVFRVQIEFGDGVQKPDAQCTKEVNGLLDGLKPGLKLVEANLRDTTGAESHQPPTSCQVSFATSSTDPGVEVVQNLETKLLLNVE